jgi:Zn-finger protein
MARIVGRSPLQQSLQESMLNLVEERHGTKVKDNNNCLWCHHSKLVRNQFHPLFDEKVPHAADEEDILHELEHRNAWQNEHTGEVHEGHMLVHPNGHAEPYAHGGAVPRMFHANHYYRMVD